MPRKKNSKISVQFLVMYSRPEDLETAKDALSHLARDIKVINVIELANVLVCESSRATYERVFQAKLQYQDRMVNNVNHGPRKISELVEVREAQIPRSLKGIVLKITLNRTIYLTD